jgi:hypothetical protein
LVAFIAVTGAIMLLKLCCGFVELWFKRIAKMTLFAGFEFVAMNIFYWSVAHLLYNHANLFSGPSTEPPKHTAFRSSCSAASSAWICIYGLYSFLRLWMSRIGGVYMLKRVIVATILAASAYEAEGRYKAFLAPMAVGEAVFMVVRFRVEKPDLKRQRVFIVVETVLMLIAYFTIYLWNDTGFVSVYVSIIIFFFILLLTTDLIDVYLDNRDEYYDEKVRLLPGLRHKQYMNGGEYEQLQQNHEDGPETDVRLRGNGR